MKKYLVMVLATGLMTAAAVGSAQAAATDTCAMSVTIAVNVGVDVVGDPLAFGSVAPGGTAVTGTGATVTNNGSTTETFQLQITGKPAQWSAVETASVPGNEQFKLLGIFTTSTPVSGDFTDVNHIVDNSGTTNASATVYAKAGEGAAANGLSCTATAVRKLWFKFIAPTSTALTTQQFITVTVSAVQG